MFIINVEYIASLEEIEKHLQAHRDFLELHYQKGLLLASGPQNPRTGGIIIALGQDRSVIEIMIKEDPFAKAHVARYTITEFSPVKYQQEIKDLI